ncbi:MAG: large conductance mechanosensitive channel protein MscL [Clostridia bacterium]|nr:large conductance mechanosensitive channel protein MscL [Clostridia bacterium]MBR5544607.1 large conductance mechanosensitive channel protein MscL [Clostridia bacterium]
MKGFFKEFKEFAMRGNVIDLAVGVIIGGAFQKIVTSVVNDLVMPLIGLITKGSDFASKFVALDGGEYATIEEATEAGAAILTYGNFIAVTIDFIIMAFVIFLLVKGLNKLTSIGKKEEPVVEAAPTTKVCPFCKSEIAIDATKCAHCTSDVE